MSVHISKSTTKEQQDMNYELVKLVADGNGRLKKGSNEVTKAAARGTAKLVIMAANVNPGELLANIPLICEEKKIPFTYVEDQAYLAEAAGMNAGAKTAAIALMEIAKGAEDSFNAVKSHSED